jgi:hypothetical protein
VERAVSATARSLAAWWWLVLRYALRDLWDGLPGPWWCKVALVAVCTAIPGGLDEVVLLALTAAWRRWRARRQAAA